MSTNYLILILTFFTILLLIMGGFLYMNITTRKRYEKLWEVEKAKIPFDKLKRVKSTLNRVDLITRDNKKYLKVNRRISHIYDDIIREFSSIKKLEIWMDEVLKHKKINRKKLKKGISDIAEYANATIKMLDTFFVVAKQITHQDELMRNEFSFYQKNLRMVSEVYSFKRIHLRTIALKIDNLNLKIKKLEKEYEDAVMSADTENANTIIKKYASMVIKYIDIVNEGPAINITIQEQIPKMAIKLERFYLQKKKELNSPIGHINFKQSMIKIANTFSKAKDYFHNLEIDKSKEAIKKTLKGFKSLEKLINLEIRSRNKFTKNFNACIKEIGAALTHFVFIKKQYKQLATSGKNINLEVQNQYQEVRKQSNELDRLAMNFRKLIKDKDIPYSSKLARMKLVVLATNKLVEELNDFIEILWSINLEESIIKNKFIRIEDAFNDLVGSTKKHNIQLSSKQNRELERLTNMRSDVARELQGRVNKSIVEKVNTFILQFTNFYSLISGRTQIALHVKNMISELAPLRSANSELNFDLQQAEKNFLEGKYGTALNGIIDSVNKEKNK